MAAKACLAKYLALTTLFDQAVLQWNRYPEPPAPISTPAVWKEGPEAGLVAEGARLP